MAHISFVSCRLSTYLEDSITVGLIYVDDSGVTRIKISENKMKIVKRILSKSAFSLFEFGIKGMVKNAPDLNLSSIDYLHRYQNGLMKIYAPRKIAIEAIEDKEGFFDNYFNKHVDKYFE